MREHASHCLLDRAVGTLLLGLARVDLPFRGGIVYPRADLRFLHRASGPDGVPGAGNASIALTMPTDAGLTGLTFYAQALYLDRGVRGGIALTRAMKLMLY